MKFHSNVNDILFRFFGDIFCLRCLQNVLFVLQNVSTLSKTRISNAGITVHLTGAVQSVHNEVVAVKYCTRSKSNISFWHAHILLYSAYQ